ncbi:MAG: CheR family methyltransferase [Acidimicrobiales bacterium]
MSLSEADFTFVRDLVRERSAISLDESKAYLVDARLKPIAQEQQISLSELASELRLRRRGPLADRIVEAMTTNETSWMRDGHPFESLRAEVIPSLAAARSVGPINIWSAACSSGQEPYCLAMIIADDFPHLRSRVRIVATDISEEVLAKGRAGEYSQLEVNRGMAAPLLMKHFTRKGTRWVVNDDLRKMVEFRPHNLAGSYLGLPKADLVLIRNVLIYFELEMKRRILDNIRDTMSPDGWLLLGASETAIGIDASYERVQVGRTTFYRPLGAAVRRAS